MMIVKIIISILVSLIPFNKLRIFLLNLLNNYNIKYDSHIGFGTIIIAKNVNIKNSKIGILNFIKIKYLDLSESSIANLNLIKEFSKFNCFNLSIIGSYNKIIGTDINNGYLKMNKSQFSTSNIININNKFEIESDVVFGGRNSKINIGSTIRKTIIKKNVYFGTSIFLVSGVEINQNVLVGAGSKITEDIYNEGLFVSHKIQKID
tara:strand:- start:14433 stop:15050 length:618 start_codon:yes stop_codon:yes gene_type:complete